MPGESCAENVRHQNGKKKKSWKLVRIRIKILNYGLKFSSPSVKPLLGSLLQRFSIKDRYFELFSIFFFFCEKVCTYLLSPKFTTIRTIRPDAHYRWTSVRPDTARAPYRDFGRLQAPGSCLSSRKHTL